jgi:hypothetical protein
MFGTPCRLAFSSCAFGSVPRSTRPCSRRDIPNDCKRTEIIGLYPVLRPGAACCSKARQVRTTAMQSLHAYNRLLWHTGQLPASTSIVELSIIGSDS